MPIQPQHQATIDRLTAHFQADPDCLALIIGGSVVKGWALPNSDVDFMAVVTDEAYARRAANREFQFFSLDFTDYEGGYVDGKIIDLAFLHDVAARGSETARSAFVKAYATYARLPGLDDLLAQITAYPDDAERERRMQGYYCQIEMLRWFAAEAAKRADPYMMAHTASQLAFFGGRLILAHNRILYPYHKWFTRVLTDAPDKPADFMARFNDLVTQPSQAAAEAFCECLLAHTEWPQPPEGWPARFMQDSEWNWRTGVLPPAEW